MSRVFNDSPAASQALLRVSFYLAGFPVSPATDAGVICDYVLASVLRVADK